MRIAVIQLEVAPPKRSRALQAALDAINSAAEKDPAPDLILLPAFVDVLAVHAGMGSALERINAQTTGACGSRAREWGIFIAFALAERNQGMPYVTSLLLDRDGDICSRNRQTVFDSLDGQRFSAGETLGIADVLLGRIALVCGDDVRSPAIWEAAVAADAQIVLASGCWPSAPGERKDDDLRARVAEQVKRFGLWCAVADTTAANAAQRAHCAGQSAIFSDKGEIIATAAAGQTTTLWADVTLPELSPRE